MLGPEPACPPAGDLTDEQPGQPGHPDAGTIRPPLRHFAPPTGGLRRSQTASGTGLKRRLSAKQKSAGPDHMGLPRQRPVEQQWVSLPQLAFSLPLKGRNIHPSYNEIAEGQGGGPGISPRRAEPRMAELKNFLHKTPVLKNSFVQSLQNPPRRANHDQTGCPQKPSVPALSREKRGASPT